MKVLHYVARNGQSMEAIPKEMCSLKKVLNKLLEVSTMNVMCLLVKSSLIMRKHTFTKL